jgi:hypothetical protein
MTSGLDDDENQEPDPNTGSDKSWKLDKKLLEIIDKVLESKSISQSHSDYFKYVGLLQEMFITYDQMVNEISSAYIFQTQNLPNIRFKLALSLLYNSFLTIEKGFCQQNPRYIDTSRRIFNDLSQFSGGQDNSIEFILDSFDILTRLTLQTHKEIAKMNENNSVSPTMFMTLKDILFVEDKEYLASYSLDNTIPDYKGTRKMMPTFESKFQKAFVKKYQTIAQKKPSQNLIDMAILAANCYDITNYVISHELMIEEIANFKDGATPIEMPEPDRDYHNENRLKAGICAALNHLADIYKKDLETIAQEINERRTVIQRISMDMSALEIYSKNHQWGFNSNHTKEVQFFADAYSTTLSNFLNEQDYRGCE